MRLCQALLVGLMLVLFSCQTVDKNPREWETKEDANGFFSYSQMSFNKLYYLPYQGVKPVDYKTDLVQEHSTKRWEQESKICLEKGMINLKGFMANMHGDEDWRLGSSQTKEINEFAVWVNDYRSASPYVRKTPAKLRLKKIDGKYVWAWYIATSVDRNGDIICHVPSIDEAISYYKNTPRPKQPLPAAQEPDQNSNIAYKTGELR